MPLGDWTLIQLFIEKMRKWKPFITQSIVAATSHQGGNENTKCGAGSITHLECRNPSINERPTPLRSILEEDGNTSSPAPCSSGEKEKRSPAEDSKEDKDEEDTNSLASVAGSEHSLLLRKSSSPPET